MDEPDRHLVIGVLLRETPHDNPAYEPIIEALSDLIEPYSTTYLKEPIALKNLLPQEGPLGYYNYLGSLTTPPCSPVVTWLLAEPANYIGTRQLVALGGVKDADGHAGITNVRHLQPINGRVVKFID